MSHKKFGPDRFSRFDVYWIQTNKQTNKQADKPNLYIYRRIKFRIRQSRSSCASSDHDFWIQPENQELGKDPEILH